ncbi:hypothetical protein MMC17_005803 [Xylographa soralifera]|nr:hypothetical protein [Xylographa soralifera]
MVTSPALFFQTVKTASDHIQHFGLSLGEVEHDPSEYLARFTNLIIKPSTVRGGKLQSLYLRFNNDLDTKVFDSRSWKWTCFILGQNQRVKRIDHVYLCFEFKCIPKSDFLHRLEREIEGWSSTVPKHRFIDQSIEEQAVLRSLNLSGMSDRYVRIETYMEELRGSISGAQTHVVAKTRSDGLYVG